MSDKNDTIKMSDKNESIKQLLQDYHKNWKRFADKLSSEDLKTAEAQYKSLRRDLETVKKDPRKANMIQKQGTPGIKQETSFSQFDEDESVKFLVKLLKMKQPNDNERAELTYLMNARYILEQSMQSEKLLKASHSTSHQHSSQDTSVHSASSSKTNPPAVQGSGVVPKTQTGSQSLTQLTASPKTELDSHPCQLSQTCHGFPTDEGQLKPGILSKTEHLGNRQDILAIQSASSNSKSKDVSKPSKDRTGSPPTASASDGLNRTYNVPPKEKEHSVNENLSKTVDSGKPPNTPKDAFTTEKSEKRPIHVLLTKHTDGKAQRNYETLLQKYTQLYKGHDIRHSWDDATDIDDITKDQKAKALDLFKYLKQLWEHRTKHGTSETQLKEAFSEFIILTGFMENRKKVDIHEQSPYLKRASGNPLHKVLTKMSKSPRDIEFKQYSILLKDDDNFKIKFPDKHRELKVFMEDPEEYPHSNCQQLYDTLRQLKRTDPLYKEAWKEYFYLVTSGQQYVLATNIGQLVKTVYKKDIDSMVIPRKSYEDLQNELLEKIKQIDELTSRLSKFASRELTAGNPNIADLSDKHRPTKIGEMYGELYDNEWSEAFEVLKPLEYPGVNEEDLETEYFEKVLKTLAKILMAAFEFSAEKAEEHLQEIKHSLLSTIMFTKIEKSGDNTKEAECDRFVTGQAMKCRKEAAVYTIKAACEAFKRDRLKSVFQHKTDDPKLIEYVDKCVELTWYMRIQDPPMHLHFLQEKEDISKAQFAFHGRKGKKVLICVWPALLLFQDGHLVTKGHVLPEEP